MGDEKPKAGGMQRVAEEAFTPAAKEFGKEIVPLGKAAGALTNRVGQLLLRSIGGLVYAAEKIEEYIKKELVERLKDVPPEKIVEPQLRIAVPVIQALTYSLDEKHIAKMFANLLAADMNADTKKDVHPAFVEFIKEMTSAEAKLLLALKDGDQIEGNVRFGTHAQFIDHARSYSFDVEGVDKEDYPTALDNLDRLGLIDFKDDHPTRFNKWMSEVKVESVEMFVTELEELNESHKAWLKDLQGASGFAHFRGVYLTSLGRAFVNLCMKGLK